MTLRWLVAAATAMIIGLQTGADPVAPGSVDQIRERLQPFGELCRAGEGCGSSIASGPSGPMSGAQVYDKFCFACHSTGVSGAPKLGDADAWAERSAKGMDTLWDSTLNGLNLMPAKGTCMGCSDEELRAAIDHMMN